VSASEHLRWEDDLAAYALGALDDPERRAFEAHLAGCDRCRTELRWLEPAIDVLPASVEQLEPPAGLRRRIVDEAGADARAAETERRRARQSRWRLGGGLRPAFAGLATVVALLAGLAVGYALDDNDEPVTETVSVQAAAPAQKASAAIVRKGDGWTLDVSQLPGLRPGDVYQVWMQDGDKIIPSVLFVPSQGNHATVALPERMAVADQLMVTREPSGGSRAPTSAPLLSAELH
jgi:anti-sigma-K factor RskA